MSSMFERPILIYSDYCIHSTNFINGLMKNPEIFDIFIRVNIDIDPNTRQRPEAFYQIQNVLQHKIAEVPTIIIDNGNGILSGVEAFQWLEYQLNRETAEELTPFNPVEMGSFSDSYSTYGSDNPNDAREQTFKFINKPDQKINTPQEDSNSVSQDAYSKKQQERENFDNIQGNGNGNGKGMGGNGMNANRMGGSGMNEMNRSGIGMNANRMGGNGMNEMNRNGVKVSDKYSETEMRFQKMMDERNSLQINNRNVPNVY
jgi:hypothetical protein